MGRAVKHGILYERVADRLVANLYVAAALDAADYQLNGNEKLGDIQNTLKQSEQLAKIVTTNLGQLVRQSAQTQAASGKLPSWMVRGLQWISDSTIGEFVLAKATKDVDHWVVVSAFYALSMSNPESEAFLKNNPQASVAVAAISSFLERVRTELCKLVNSLMISQVLWGILVGMGAPLSLTGLLALCKKYLPKQATPNAMGC